MKLISLNVWGGKQFEPLMAFLKKESADADVLCLQEVFDAPAPYPLPSGARAMLFKELCDALPDFRAFFSPEQDGFDIGGPAVAQDISFGKATFVRKDLRVHEQGSFFVFGERNGMKSEKDLHHWPKNAHFVSLRKGETDYVIVNFHGSWFPYDKLDTEDRILQSAKLLEFLVAREEQKQIVCGDFNLHPETKSISLLELKMKNLIRAYTIQSTRSALYEYEWKDAFADYMFVSPAVEVQKFEVPHIAVSDHLPMILECA